MALNLACGGTRLVWNRSPERCEPLRAIGASVAASVAEVFAQTDIVIPMLVDEAASDSVLGRGTPGFGEMVAEHVVVNMASIAPAYSRNLEADIRAAGGWYVEAPVSGSRKSAEAGQLVALLGGDALRVEEVRPLLGPMCRETVICGSIGRGAARWRSVARHATSIAASERSRGNQCPGYPAITS